jgi:phosphonate transport system permease protein
VTDSTADAGSPRQGLPDAVAAFERQRAALLRVKRRQSAGYGLLFVAVLLAAGVVGRFDLVLLVEGLPRVTEYLGRLMPVLRVESLGSDLASWYYAPGRWLRLLLETVLMAYLATLLGTIGALVLCFPASRNLMSNTAVYFAARRLLEIARTVPDLVYALIFVFAFGLGALPGVLAMAVHSLGASGKLFAELNENADLAPFQAVRAAGGNWIKAIRLAVVPQMLPGFTTFTLWRFELNLRSASVIGFVGAGGIGQELFTAIRVQYYEDVSAILLMILATIGLIDIGCGRLRRALMERESRI